MNDGLWVAGVLPFGSKEVRFELNRAQFQRFTCCTLERGDQNR